MTSSVLLLRRVRRVGDGDDDVKKIQTGGRAGVNGSSKGSSVHAALALGGQPMQGLERKAGR